MAASSLGSSPRQGNDADFDENDSFDLDEEKDYGIRTVPRVFYLRHGLCFPP